MKKKILSALLLSVLIVGAFLFTGCSEPKLSISEEEAFAVLSDLVPGSYDINVLLVGKGLPAAEEAYAEEHTATAYFAVREDAPWQSIAEMKKAAEAIFSDRYLESAFVPAFAGVVPESNDGNLDTSVSPRYTERNGKLYVDVSYPAFAIRGRMTVLSSEIVKCTPENVILNMRYEADGTEGEMRIFLAKQENGWRLDSPTY